MAKNLIVTHDFGEFKHGDRISDADKVAEVLASENANKVIAVEVADKPAPVKA